MLLPRSGIYCTAQHLNDGGRVELSSQEAVASRPTLASYREELGIFLRLWLVIVAAIAVIMLGCWLVRG